MVMHARMQSVVMWVLAVMLITAIVLATVAIANPASAAPLGDGEPCIRCVWGIENCIYRPAMIKGYMIAGYCVGTFQGCIC